MSLPQSRKLGELWMNQAELARITSIRPTTISDLYNELAERVNLEHFDLICEACLYNCVEPRLSPDSLTIVWQWFIDPYCFVCV